MAYFDDFDSAGLQIRQCRNRAKIARYFAESPLHHANADAWAYIAQAWTRLADLKERIDKYSD